MLNAYPIVILCGKARSGKDTAAGFIAEFANTTQIALADPIKRIAQKLFKFSDAQLWGPSERRGEQYHLSREEAAVLLFSPRYTDILDGEIKGIISNEQYRRALESFSRFVEDNLLAEIASKGFVTPRYALQAIGTEWGRNQVDTSLWTNITLRHAQRLLSGGWIYTPNHGLRQAIVGPASDLVVISDGRFRNEILKVRKLGGLAIHIVRPDPDDLVGKGGIAGHQSEVEQEKIPPHFYNTTIYNDGSLSAFETYIKTVIKEAYRDSSPQYCSSYDED